MSRRLNHSFLLMSAIPFGAVALAYLFFPSGSEQVRSYNEAAMAAMVDGSLSEKTALIKEQFSVPVAQVSKPENAHSWLDHASEEQWMNYDASVISKEGSYQISLENLESAEDCRALVRAFAATDDAATQLQSRGWGSAMANLQVAGQAENNLCDHVAKGSTLNIQFQ